MRYYLGIDVGSVSVKAAVVGAGGEVLAECCRRSRGEPGKCADEIIAELGARFPIGETFTTGSGGKKIRGIFTNEVIALSAAAARFLPAARTIIEMGGEDSKLLRMEGGRLADFSANSVCAAGTGSFLDQQASRLGYTIEEFSAQALKSQCPPRIAGRCTVFAKSDMIHLQQKGTPDYEIIAGLCLAVARNFLGTIARGKKIERPVAFLGGVAANAGMVRAFETITSLQPGEMTVPPHYQTMGAIGAALYHLGNGKN